MAHEKGEILAPAGGAEQLLAAVRCGADAVYLGGKRFNARRNAANFGDTDLSEAVAYCHARNVSVYVTVNTVLLDGETDALEDEAAYIAASGADAAIIQDMSVLRLFAARYPSIKRYASTQTAVHNVDGARFLMDMGFDSIVLARELTLTEMEAVCTAVPLKMEAFLHGAHCMSVSGACYLSAMLGGRSGNRGLCAQPCRLDWHCGARDYALSLKDMSLIPHFREMVDAGVDSFKIEGRMKRPEYVAAAVTACRHARDGEPYDAETLRAVFSRSGFTDGYLTGRRDASMYGVRTKEDAADAGGVLGTLSALYRNETPRVPVDMRFALNADGAQLTVSDGTHEASACSGAPEPALHRPLDEASVQKSLAKTGGTPFSLRSLSVQLEKGLLLPASALNAMRREALDALLSARSVTTPHAATPYTVPPVVRYRAASERPALWGRFPSEERIVCADAYERILLPAERITPALIARFGERLIAELPALLFPANEEAFSASLAALKDAGLSAVYAGNIYGLALGRRLGLIVHGGFRLNVTNTAALEAYAEQGLSGMTLSFEPSMAQLRALGGTLPRGVIAYGYLPLMHFRNCPVRAALGCARCGGDGALTDRMGVRFPVLCGEQSYAVLLNSVPLDIAGRDLGGFDHALLYFTKETAPEAEAVTERFLRGERTALPHTNGLYYRELL